MQTSRQKIGLGVGLLAWALSWALLLLVRSRLGLDAPLGSDASLWGLSAMALTQGQLPAGSPLYPALVALCPGPAWWWGGVVSAACLAAVPPVLVTFLRREGVSWGLAVVLGLLPLLSPMRGMMGLQIQPDALTQLLLLLVAGAGLRWEAAPTPRRAGRWLAAALLLALAREHGLVVLAALGVLWLRVRGVPGWALILLAIGGGLGVWLGADHLPARLRIPLQSSPLGAGRYPLPEYMTHFRGAKGRPLVEAWNAGEGLRFWGLTVGAMLREGAAHLPLVLLGAVGFGAAQRLRSGAVVLAPALTLLFFWSQERHSAVLVPAALLGAGLGLARLPGRLGQLAALAVLVALSAAQIRAWPLMLQRAQGTAQHSRALQALTDQLTARLEGSPPMLLAGLENEANLYLGWPRHVPILQRGCVQTRWDGAAWRSIWIAPAGLMPPPMQEILQVGHMGAYWLPAAETERRPCTDLTLPEGPLYVRGLHDAAVTGTCEADVPAEWAQGLPRCPPGR